MATGASTSSGNESPASQIEPKIYLTRIYRNITFYLMKWKQLKTVAFFELICCIGFSLPAQAQVYSSGPIGYYSLSLFSGNNLIANQLGNSSNTLNTIFQQQKVPEGTTFTKWNSTSLQYLPLSRYDTNSGWSINYELSYGEGGLLNSPSPFTATLVGTLWPGYTGGSINPPLVSSYGILLLSCYLPINQATFYDVVGRNPQNGESVTTLNPLSQISTTTTFESGSWNNGDPLLNVGQAAFFDLESVPEPEVLYLFGSGVVLLAVYRRITK